MSLTGTFTPSPFNLSATSSPLFMFTAFPTPTTTPSMSLNTTTATVAASADTSSNTGTILGGLAVGLVGVLGAVMVFMNAPTKTINTFLVNIINRVPLPDSVKNAIGNDPLGKLKSMRIPKGMIDNLPVPDSVKSAIESVLPGNAEAPPGIQTSSAQAPTLVDDKVVDIVVPVATAAVVTTAVVSKTVSAPAPPRIAFAEVPVARASIPEPIVVVAPAPAPAPRPAPVSTPAPAPKHTDTITPKLVNPRATSPPPPPRAKPPPPPPAKKPEQKQDQKAKIEVDAKDLAAIQAYLKSKNTQHKVI